MSAPFHDPVMMDEVLDQLALQPGMLAVDGTLGLAGHARRIHERIQPGGTLVGLDWDTAMLAIARENLPADARLFHTDYRGLPAVLEEHFPGRRADAILLDLGLNSTQIEDAERGITFLGEGPLDMRMDRTKGEPASALLNRASEDMLEKMLREYGGERWSRRIAKIILERRKQQPLRTTHDLVECVLAAIPAAMRDKRIHPATRTFQAIRIAVNGELEDLEQTIVDIALCLSVGGTLVVLSYHSGEDAPTKNAFRRLARNGFTELQRKPLTPTPEEVARNRRSRSAKLRSLRRHTLEYSS